MTQISPRHQAEQRDMTMRFTQLGRAIRREEQRELRANITQAACAIALVILAAAAGYLAHTPEACADLTAHFALFN